MRVDRLIGILSILLQNETVTAPELADRFEITRRTIYRDIEELCKAGIPIATRQGRGGGIYIMDGFKIDRTLFTNSEIQDILAGLRSLDSVHGTNRYVQLMEKLSVGSSDFMRGNQSILIDLSSWYKNSLAEKIAMIRSAIENKRELLFCYYSSKGESNREIEPYYLIFQWSSWYIWGWCKMREDFRLFKLTRMEQLSLSQNCFEGRYCPLPDLRDTKVFPGGIAVKALFNPENKWRLIEEYGPACYTEQEDGRLLFQTEYANKDYLMSWLFSFRDGVELLEPREIREEMKAIIDNMKNIYL